MLIYLILTVCFALVTIVSFGVVIFSVVKKRPNMLRFGAVLVIACGASTIISGLMYSQKVVNYVKSGEFQTDTRKGAALVGKTIGSASSGLSDGVAKTLDDEAIKNLAGKSASIVAKVTKTVASTLDSTIGTKNIFLDQSVSETGIELGRATEKYQSNGNDLQVFISFKKNFKGKLRLTNYDQMGKKLEQVEKAIFSTAGEERVEIFHFPNSEFGITTYFILAVAK